MQFKHDKIFQYFKEYLLYVIMVVYMQTNAVTCKKYVLFEGIYLQMFLSIKQIFPYGYGKYFTVHILHGLCTGNAITNASRKYASMIVITILILIY